MNKRMIFWVITLCVGVGAVAFFVGYSARCMYLQEKPLEPQVFVEQREYKPVIDSEGVKSVPDGVYTAEVGSVLRIDDVYVDDQFFVFVSSADIAGSEHSPIKIELSNDVKITLQLNSHNATKHAEEVSLDVFRNITRAESKSNKGFTTLFRIKVENGLITNIEELPRPLNI